MAAKKKSKKKWTAAERKAFGAKMKALRAAKAGSPKPRRKKSKKRKGKKTVTAAAPKKTKKRRKKAAPKRAAPKRAAPKRAAPKKAAPKRKKSRRKKASFKTRRLSGAALKRHETKLRREAYGKLGRSGPISAPVVTAMPGTAESIRQQLALRKHVAVEAKRLADAYAHAKKPSKKPKPVSVTAKDIIQAKPLPKAKITASEAVIHKKRAPVKLKTRRAPILGPRKFTAVTKKPSVWACSGRVRTGCGGGKQGGHVVAILRP